MPKFIPPTFDDLITEATEHMLAVGYHISTIFAVGSRNVLVVMGDMPTESKVREWFMYAVGRQTARENIGTLRDVYCIMEAWMGLFDPDNPTSMPSDDPNRIEVLMLSHYDLRASRLDLVVFALLRDGHGNLSDLAKIADTRDRKDSAPESPMIDAFMSGYHDARRGGLPRTTGPRG